MKFTWGQLWAFVGALPNKTPEESTVVAAATGMLITFEDDARKGVFWCATPKGGKAFAIQSDAEGLSFGWPLNVDLNVEDRKFMDHYKSNPLSLLGSFDWKKI